MSDRGSPGPWRRFVDWCHVTPVTKATFGLGVLLYLFLWYLMIVVGVTGLMPILVIPLVIMGLIAANAWMTRILNLPTKSPKFKHPDTDEGE